ncbi:hypothetical protein AFLA70_521g000751 [Aspergillus flavus AF70]|nr:hypothetical protein AFLA70_521g000751 [Aspergillus flavus AF70]
MLRRLQDTLVDTTQSIARLTAEYTTYTSHNVQGEYEGFDNFEAEASAPYVSPIPLNFGPRQHGFDLGLFSLYKGLPFFSPECQRWVKLCTGESIDVNQLFHSQAEDYYPSCSVVLQSPGGLGTLPPRSELDLCLRLFYSTELSRVFPVVEVTAIPVMVNAIYSETATVDIIACIYALITFITGFTEGTSFSIDPQRCEAQVRLLIPDLLLHSPTMASLQTMLLMALCQMTQGNIQAVYQFIAIAAGMLHGLGGNVPSESHVRTLFWVTYILDKDLSLRTGRPPVICDDHYDLRLPSAYSEYTAHLPPTEQPFWTDLRLSIIKSKAYTSLYSARALKSTDVGLIKAIRELGSELDEWRLMLPVGHRPAYGEPSEYACKEIRWILIHLDFHRTVTLVYQASSRCTHWLENRRLGLGVQSCFDICVAASRSSLLHLIKASQIQLHDPNFWVVIVFPLSASISLFCNILLNPLGPEVTEDLDLMSRAPASIFQLSTKRPSQNELTQYHALVRFTTELSRLANRAIANAHGA